MDLTAKELYDQYGKEGVLLELKGNLKVKIKNII